MQNISWRQPGTYSHHYNYFHSFSEDRSVPCSNQFIIRTQTGYVGPKPKTRPLPPHNYAINCQNITLGNVFNGKYSNGDTEDAVGGGLSVNVGGATFYPPYDVASLRNRLIDKLNDKVRGDLDISVDLAEAGKTAKMLKLCDNAVAYSQMFKRRFGTLKTMAGAWLEYTYGIKPTVSTIFGTATELHNHAYNLTSKYKARVTDTYSPKYVSLPTIFGAVDFQLTGARIFVSMSLGVDVRNLETDVARFSSLNPVSIAWELTPYSFVVDWFLNVGGYLHSLETALLYASRFRSGYQTIYSRGDVSFVRIDAAPGYTSTWKGNVKHVDLQRTILTSYPSPSLPSFQVNLGSSRLISAASLIAQFLGRGKVSLPLGDTLNDKRLKSRIQQDARYFLDKAEKRAAQFPKTYAHL